MRLLGQFSERRTARLVFFVDCHGKAVLDKSRIRDVTDTLQESTQRSRAKGTHRICALRVDRGKWCAAPSRATNQISATQACDRVPITLLKHGVETAPDCRKHLFGLSARYKMGVNASV